MCYFSYLEKLVLAWNSNAIDVPGDVVKQPQGWLPCFGQPISVSNDGVGLRCIKKMRQIRPSTCSTFRNRAVQFLNDQGDFPTAAYMSRLPIQRMYVSFRYRLLIFVN